MIARFLNGEKKIYTYPKKRKARQEVLEYFLSFFEDERIYSEKEVNEIVNQQHSFNDPCLIRRELVDNRYLVRTRDCKEYKKNMERIQNAEE